MEKLVFNVKGLTAQDRAQWEKDNIDKLRKMNFDGYKYDSFDEDTKNAVFKNLSFKNKFGDRDDYSTLIAMSPERRDSLFMAFSDSNIEEDENLYQKTLNRASSMYSKNLWGPSNGPAVGMDGMAEQDWNILDGLLRELSPYYSRFAGTEYYPLSNERKVEIMSKLAADTGIFGQDVAVQKLVNSVQDEVSHNQTILEKLYHGFAGAGANIVGSLISFAGNLGGFGEGLLGLGYLDGSNRDPNYFKNIWLSGIDNPLTRYGNKVMQQGVLFVSNDPEQAYDRHEIIRTVKEQENLINGIFSVNTIPELIDMSGFTFAAMLEGQGLALLGNGIFNTVKAATMAGKVEATAQTLSRTNAAMKNIGNLQRINNAYIVPSLVGTGEGAMNALNTKMDFLEDANRLMVDRYETVVQQEVIERLRKEKIPQKYINSGTEEEWVEKRASELELQVRNEIYNPSVDPDVLNRIEKEASDAALVDFAINSVMNGMINTGLKAAMYGSRTVEALRRTKIDKLFSGSNFTIDDTGNVIAKKIGAGRMAVRAGKEVAGQMIEEWGQDVSSATSKGSSEHDFRSYLEQKYNGIAEDAIVENVLLSTGAALAAAGRAAISKEALQSGIYAGLSQVLGTPNINSIITRDTQRNWKSASSIERLNSIYRMPIIESILADKKENQNRAESAKAINDWLNEGNNRDKFISLQGSLGWAKSMQEAANNGDEFNFRNSRLGKLVQDYFLLEHLKGTQLYDAFLQRYTDIIDAKEGDEMARQIAEYDDRPLEDIQADAKNMLKIMNGVQEATVDLEKSLGNSIPQEVKEALIFGKISLKDRKERGESIKTTLNEIVSNVGDSFSTPDSGLSDKSKLDIALYGNNPTEYLNKVKSILEGKIKTIEDNKKIMSDKKLSELRTLKKELKRVNSDLRRVESLGDSHLLSEKDIMGLSAEDRFIILNPNNLKHYGEEQQKIIGNVIANGTVQNSRFMNLVEDAARLETSQKEYLKLYNEALHNPDILRKVDATLKFERKIEDTKKSYESLKDIKDYNEFSKSIDSILKTANGIEKIALYEALKGNPFFAKYQENNSIIDGIYEQLIKNDAFKELKEEDKRLVYETTKYLANKGVDISNYDAVVAELNSVNSEGTPNLTHYINEINKLLPENNKISLDNIGSVITSYKKSLESLKKNDEIKAQIEAKPQDAEVQPSTPPFPTNIFDTEHVSSSLEESDRKQREQEYPEQAPQKQTNDGDDSAESLSIEEISDDFILNNNQPIINEVSRIFNSVKKASSKYGDDAKSLTIDTINSLGKTKFNSTNDLKIAINNAIKDLKSKVNGGGDIFERTSSLLQQISYSIGEQVASDEKAVEQPSKPTDDSISIQADNSISLAKINGTFRGVLGDLFRMWKVDEYIRSGKLSRKPGESSTVYYAALDSVTNSVKKSMGDKYIEDRDKPILAVVQDDNGPIEINGKKYQPIGVLQNSSRDPMAKKIRELSKSTPWGRLISSGNTLLYSSATVVSPRIGITSKESDSDFTKLIYEALSPEDAAAVGDINNSERRSIWEKYIDKVISRLRIEKNTKGVPTLYYVLPSMKGDQSETKIALPTKLVSETVSVGDGISFLEAISKKNPLKVITFNSRTRAFGNTIFRLLKHNSINELTSDGTVFTGGEKAIQAINKIDSVIRRSIYPASSEKFSVKPVIINGNLGLDLYLGEENLGRLTSDVSSDISTEEFNNNIGSILSNLIAPSGNYRENLWFQIDKDANKYKAGTRGYSKQYLYNLIDDNILKVPLTSLERKISEVQLSIPKEIRGPSPITPKETITNQESASTQGSNAGTAITQSGQVVDVDTGISQNGQEAKNDVKDDASEVVEAPNEKETVPTVSQHINKKIGIIYGEYEVTENGKTKNAEESAGSAQEDNEYHFTTSRGTSKNTNAYGISEDAVVVEFEDYSDYEAHKEKAENADIILLKKSSTSSDTSEIIIKKDKANLIIKQQPDSLTRRSTLGASLRRKEIVPKEGAERVPTPLNPTGISYNSLDNDIKSRIIEYYKKADMPEEEVEDYFDSLLESDKEHVLACCDSPLKTKK